MTRKTWQLATSLALAATAAVAFWLLFESPTTEQESRERTGRFPVRPHETIEKHFSPGGDPVDYPRMMLWKEDGVLKSAFMEREMEFPEIAALWQRLAAQGKTNLAVQWNISGDVTMREAAEKIGELAALGFADQFCIVQGASTNQTLIFTLEDIQPFDALPLEE